MTERTTEKTAEFRKKMQLIHSGPDVKLDEKGYHSDDCGCHDCYNDKLDTLYNQNSFENPMDRKTAEEIINRSMESITQGYYFCESVSFVVNNQKYSVIAYGDEETDKPEIHYFLFVKEKKEKKRGRKRKRGRRKKIT